MGKIGNIDFGYLKNSQYIIGQFQQQKFETLMKKSLFFASYLRNWIYAISVRLKLAHWLLGKI